MTAFLGFDPFERRISDAFEEITDARRPDYLDDILQLTARTSQRPRWTFPERWLPLETVWPRRVHDLATSPRLVLAVTLVAMLLAAVLAMTGALSQRPIAPPTLGGVFSPGGTLPVPATKAIVRADGQVLIFGGRGAFELGAGALKVAPEAVLLFDPTSGDSHLIGTTTSSVSYAVQLADGRVMLIEPEIPTSSAGGSSGLSMAEVLDPDHGTITAVSSAARGTHLFGAGVLLDDGRVLLVGDAAGTTGADLVDPLTGFANSTGSTPVPMLQPTATRLLDGRVLVVGTRERLAAIYDPATETFTATGPMSSPHEGFTATLLLDGRVLIVGGWSTAGTVVDDLFHPSETPHLGASAEIFDPRTGQFSSVGPLVVPRVLHFAVALESGLVLIGGGTASNAADGGSGGIVEPAILDAEVFTPGPNTFTRSGPLGTPRFGAGAVRLLDGRVLVVGSVLPSGSGQTGDPVAASSLEIYR